MSRPRTSVATAIASETTKLLTTRLWWVLAVIMAGYVALCAGGIAAILGGLGSAASGPQIPEAQLPLLVYSFATSVGYVFPVLLGALAVTSEFRFQSLTPTFLAIPRRGLVLTGKLVTLLVAGAAFGAIALAASMGVGAGILAAVGVDPLLGEPEVWAFVGRSILAMALWSAIGVGLGTLVPSQVAAIVIVLAFTQFVEPLLRLGASFTDWSAQVAQYLPGSASDALVGSSIYTAMSGGTGLVWWQGGLVLAAYALVTTVIGFFTSWRRDVS
ncbi:ABC transporter permease [Herbiconiux moechotypicola]|uniref:ABC transporter permease n=1 Tax=Herbiconiux moechotypicola TaxID=637393 RepID=A0ABN3DBU6_9MICO|nr:ABC transporter permease [Herbiconiux moechotypicola]MCS5728838.1 ABC transporter permease [Herbiconiux moechotypicola]